MRHELLYLFNHRLLGLIAVLPGLFACDAFDFNGENISPAESFPIVYVKRSVNALAEPIDPSNFVAGGDLYWRDAASASAEEINLTKNVTAGRGDVSSPEISYDGKTVVFSMRRATDAGWNIWTMNVASKQLTQITADDAFNDTHPHFLVDGRIVFSSDQQEQNRQLLTANNIESFSYLDPKGRHAASLLHVMNADGSGVNQISFHVGHDSHVGLLGNGKLVFNRWESTGQRNHLPLITMNPDGTAIETLYGAYSKGNSFLNARELPNGKLVAIHAPVAGAHGGGALVEIDVSQYGDINDRVRIPLPGSVPLKQISLNTINIESGVSQYGRFLSPYPIFDNTNRILVSWSASNKTDVSDLQTDTIKTIEGDPSYGVYIMDLASGSMSPIVTANNGMIAYDAIAVQSRTAPVQIDDAFSGIGGVLDAALEASGEGVVHVRSVYDTDANGLLDSSMLVGTETIPLIPAQSDDTRTMVADISTIKDLSLYYADERPARFVRITKPVAVPEGAGQDLVGEAGSVMQQILGYSEVEADGSVLVKVPADTPIAISVLDARGRAITNHTSWFQVRPGEVLECAGCHSPRRRTPLNVFPIAFNTPVVQLGPAQINETMAETRARVLNGDVNNPDAPDANLTFTLDTWISDYVLATAQAGRFVGPFTIPLVDQDINIDYSTLTTPAPTNGVINFVDHIQPVFDAGGANCVACHNGGQPPDLRALPDTDGVLLSYKNLVKGLVDPDPVTPANPLVNLKDGAYLTQRQVPYVRVGGARDSSRNSFLMETLSNEELRAPRVLGARDHSLDLNASELRLITEWIDTGANYYNSPFGVDVNAPIGQSNLSEIRNGITAPDFSEFKSDVYPVLQNRCASCHQSVANKSDFKKPIVASTLINPVPSENTMPRFILTGSVEGDYRAATAFIENRSTPAANSLLLKPLSTSAAPEPVHPQISDGAGGFVPVLLNTDADYSEILDWITQ